MAHKMSVCMHRDDTKLSSLALIVFVSPISWNLSRHCSVVCFVVWFVCLCFCVFVFCLCLVLFLVFVSLFLGVLPGFLDERDSA